MKLHKVVQPTRVLEPEIYIDPKYDRALRNVLIELTRVSKVANKKINKDVIAFALEER